MDKKGKSILLYFLYALFVMILIAAAAMILPEYRKNQRIKAQLSELNRELDNKKAEAVKLNQEVHDLQTTPEAIEKIAREKFGLCKPGETILKYDNPTQKR